MSQANAGKLPENEIPTEFDSLLNGFQNLKSLKAEMSDKLDVMLNFSHSDALPKVNATQERLKAQNLESQQQLTENYEEILKKQEGINQNIKVSQSFRNTMVGNLCSLDNFEKAKLYDKLVYSEKAASALMRKILSMKKEIGKMENAYVERKTKLEQNVTSFDQSTKNSKEQISDLDARIDEKNQTSNKLKESDAYKLKEVKIFEQANSEYTQMELQIAQKVSEVETDDGILIEINDEVLTTHNNIENLKLSCEDLADLIMEAEMEEKSSNERLKDSTYLKDLIQNSNIDALYSDDCFRRVVMEKSFFKEQKKTIDELLKDTTDLFTDLKIASSLQDEEEVKHETEKTELSVEIEIERKLLSELAEVEKQKLECEDKTRIENHRQEEKANKEIEMLKAKLSHTQKETLKLEHKSKKEAKANELKLKSVETKFALEVQEQLNRSSSSNSSRNSKGAPKAVSTSQQHIPKFSAGAQTVLNAKEKLQLAAEPKNAAKVNTPTGKRSIHDLLMTPQKLKFEVNNQARQIIISPVPSKAYEMRAQTLDVGRSVKIPEIHQIPEKSQKEDQFADDESAFNLSFSTDLADFDFSEKED